MNRVLIDNLNKANMQRSFIKKKFLAFSITCLTALVTITGDAAEFGLGTGLDSRYISEGRDNTDDKSLSYLELTGQSGSLSSNIWYAQSSFEDYTELNFSLAYEYELNNYISLETTYTYIDVNLDDFQDHEVSIAMSIDNDLFIVTTLSAIYSDDAEGIYSSVEFSHTLEISSIKIAPYISFNFNGGYVGDEHRGLEHFGAGIAINGGSKLVFDAYIANVSPIDKQAGDSLINAMWAGIKLIYMF